MYAGSKYGKHVVVPGSPPLEWQRVLEMDKAMGRSPRETNAMTTGGAYKSGAVELAVTKGKPITELPP